MQRKIQMQRQIQRQRQINHHLGHKALKPTFKRAKFAERVDPCAFSLSVPSWTHAQPPQVSRSNHHQSAVPKKKQKYHQPKQHVG